MRNLLQTHSISWAQTVRLTLESEGISAVVLDENAPGYMGFAGRSRVAVLHDQDLARAKQILSRLAPPVTEAPPSWKIQKRGLMLLALGFLLFIVLAGLLDNQGAGVPVYVVAATSAAAFVAGFILIALGPRADTKSGR